jgi:hypothetical protein
MDEKLIAPCGINCAVCIAYLSNVNDINKKGFHKKYCEGCLPRGKNCLHMGDSCTKLRDGLVRFCYECVDFPCRHLKTLDKRYASKYHLNVIENLRSIKEQGMEGFLETERRKWRCPDCGGTICCHNGLCLGCKLETLRQNKKYRWDEQ